MPGVHVRTLGAAFPHVVHDAAVQVRRSEGLECVYRDEAPKLWRSLVAYSGDREIAKRFGAFDHLDMPDLWDVAKHREPRPPEGRERSERASKTLVIVTALALTIATTGLLIRTFNRDADTEPVPGLTPKEVPEGPFAFTGGREGRVGGLYSVTGGRVPNRILAGDAYRPPSWSTDGKHILVIAPIPGSELDTQVIIVDAGTGQRRRLTTLRYPQAAAWSPAGDEIAFSTAHGDVYLIRPDGTGLRRLVAANNSCGAEGISWAPGGSRIAFARTCRGPRAGIWVASIDASDLRRVIADRTVFETSWSPDGNPWRSRTGRPSRLP